MTVHVSSPIEIVPASAPFSEAQRKWLNSFLLERLLQSQPVALPAAAAPGAPAEDESRPWKDPSMAIEDRMGLAVSRPLKQRMMAAMAQQDCGQCGYNCANYAVAIAEQAEPRLNLCVPGGKATARMLKSLVEEMGGGVIDPEEVAAKAAAAPKAGADARVGYSRGAPVEARYVSRRRLNGEGSEKTTMHIEIDLSGSGIDYEPGDSLGIYPRNPPALVDAVLATLDAPADFPIAGRPLREVLIEDSSLGAAPDALFQFISYLTGGERRKKALALARGEDPDGDAETLDVLAALQKFEGIRPDPEALMEVLEPMQPRLYSISSSPRSCEGKVTLTVDAVRYAMGERERLGTASTYLGERAQAGDALKVYVQKAHGFALPDGDTPIVMVGPGTGIAPFRSFLEHRQATGARGGAWLFYGHQRQGCDFFYEEELMAFREAGVLSELSTAWSRDGGQKVYVQDRMREDGGKLFGWLEAGAHFYICGDAKRMARDVEAALEEIGAAHGAPGLAARLRSEGRLQADVY